jgi:hypothetical protein
VFEGVIVGEHTSCPVTRLDHVADALGYIATQAEVMSEYFRLGLGPIRAALLENLADPGVQLMASAVQKRGVSGILNQAMLEPVAGFRRGAAAEDELGCGEPIERGLEAGLGPIHHRSQERIVEFASDAGGDLGNLLALGNAVQARHQRIVQRCRDGGLAGLQYRLGQLFDQQRHPVGARDDRIDRCERQTVAAEARDDRLDSGAGEPVEGKPRDV